MARTTLPTQADEAAQPPPPPHTVAQEAVPPPPTMPRVGVIVRIITLIFLILSISLLASNSTTIRANAATATVHFNDIYAYRYALATGVIGLSYTFLVLLSSHVGIGRFMADDPKLLVYYFLGDKVVMALLGTGVGAAFGATVDLKSKMDKLEDVLELGTTVFGPIVSKLDDFFSRAYFHAIFLLLAFLTAGVSSILSSLALLKKTT